jgi:hypothetical protein
MLAYLESRTTPETEVDLLTGLLGNPKLLPTTHFG